MMKTITKSILGVPVFSLSLGPDHPAIVDSDLSWEFWGDGHL
jgi:hypothetical protein